MIAASRPENSSPKETVVDNSISEVQEFAIVDFDSGKDARSIAKHGVSLAAAAEMEAMVTVSDSRFAEPRFRGYGLIDGVRYCLAYTRDGRLRAISLRRTRAKEFNRHVL